MFGSLMHLALRLQRAACSVMSLEGASGLAGSGGTRNGQEGANELAAKLGVLE